MRMARSTGRAKLVLSDEQRGVFQKASRSMTVPFRERQRAQILLSYSDGAPILSIADSLGVNRRTVYKAIDKALAAGAESGLKDKFHRPREASISEQAKTWVVNLACTKPSEHGYAAEMWSRSLLAHHVRRHAVKEGHPSLAKAAKATIQRILSQHPIRPHKIAYYLEKRDPEFETKMHEILVVYNEVNLWNDSQAAKTGDIPPIITLSVDEKPGVQAISNTAPDIMPNPTKNSRILRDHEYKRHGTVSILAALDLHTGNVIGQVHDRHRSQEFIELLMEIDAAYPPEHTIRLILDNHSAHTSKETMSYLATRPNRFVYVHTPKHGSWLNLVETLFGKMARTFLKSIRVKSKDELKVRIMKGLAEINQEPRIHRWHKFDLLQPVY
jgi:transposase